MTRLVLFTALLALSPTTIASPQPAADPGRAVGIMVMRAINTAENAVRQASGKYVELADLLNHGAMGRVRPDVIVDGNVITHRGQQLRPALTADAMQYQVMVVPAEPCGSAVLSDERGLIYTGRVLDC